MSEKPLVSIIMPAYNASAFIAEAIDSVLAQTYGNWELLITDDGSTDNTAAVVQYYVDPRIQIFRQANQGVSSARNAALSQMKGEFFTFLDADDFLPKKSLELRVKKMISEPSLDILAGSVAFFREKPSAVYKTWTPNFKGDPLVRLIRLDEAVFCNPSFFIRRDKNTTYSFQLGVSHGEDLLFLISLASLSSLHFDSIEHVIYLYKTGHTSAMSNLEGLEKGYWQILAFVSQLRDERITLSDLVYLRFRITRIMSLSYLRARKCRAALRAVLLSVLPLLLASKTLGLKDNAYPICQDIESRAIEANLKSEQDLLFHNPHEVDSRSSDPRA